MNGNFLIGANTQHQGYDRAIYVCATWRFSYVLPSATHAAAARTAGVLPFSLYDDAQPCARGQPLTLSSPTVFVRV